MQLPLKPGELRPGDRIEVDDPMDFFIMANPPAPPIWKVIHSIEHVPGSGRWLVICADGHLVCLYEDSRLWVERE